MKTAPDGERQLHAEKGRLSGHLSWSTHALLTRAAVSATNVEELQESVTVTPLSHFLAAGGEEIQAVARWHRELLAARSSRTTVREQISAPASDEDFLNLVHLNPHFSFAYARLRHPEEVSSELQHTPSRHGPNDPRDAGGTSSLYMETPCGAELTAWDVLFTFSDEPDWGIDQDLYVLDGQPYGEAPLGIAAGPSSQGPFHMAFFHENPFVYLLLPALRRSFVEERCRLSLALADVAFRAGVPYWGWRFAAWAVHYLQDITQPYHARAFPPSLLSVLRRFLVSGHSSRLGSLVRDTLKSRHYLFEGFVHFLFNEEAKKRAFSELASALAGSEELRQQPLENVLRLSSLRAAALAGKVNRSLEHLFGDLPLAQVEHLLSEENLAGIVEEFQQAIQARPDVFRQFESCVCVCLNDAGAVTRYALARVRERA